MSDGKQLLDELVIEAKMRETVCVYVTPEAEESYDEDKVEPMDLQKLYRKYKHLGFRFKDEKLRDYGNVIQMDLTWFKVNMHN